MLKTALHSIIVLALAAALAAAPVEQAQARHCRGFVESFARAVAAAILAPFHHHRRVVRHRHRSRHHHHRSLPQQKKAPQQKEAPQPKKVEQPRAPSQQCSWEGQTCFTNSYGDRICSGGTYVCK